MIDATRYGAREAVRSERSKLGQRQRIGAKIMRVRSDGKYSIAVLWRVNRPN